MGGCHEVGRRMLLRRGALCRRGRALTEGAMSLPRVPVHHRRRAQHVDVVDNCPGAFGVRFRSGLWWITGCEYWHRLSLQQNPIFTMAIIPDDLWPEISAGAAAPDGTRLPDAARPEVEALVKAYKQGEWAAQERVQRSTKKLLKDVTDLGTKFRAKLEEVATNQEYLHYNAVSGPVSIEPLMQVGGTHRRITDKTFRRPNEAQ
jgi:hypothetical protein